MTPAAREPSPTVVRQFCDVHMGLVVDVQVGAVLYESTALHGAAGVICDETRLRKHLQRRQREGGTVSLYLNLDAETGSVVDVPARDVRVVAVRGAR